MSILAVAFRLPTGNNGAGGQWRTCLRILLISNLYPPHYVGGYELGCREVVCELRRRGQKVLVVTSRFGVPAPTRGNLVWRVLPHEFVEGEVAEPSPPAARFARLVRRERVTRQVFAQSVASFRPEVLWIWNLRSVSVNLAFLAERSGIPVCYFVSDEWPLWLEMDPWYAIWWGKQPQGIPARLHRCLVKWLRIARPALRLWRLTPVGRLRMEYAQFTSGYLATANHPARGFPRRTTVVHWGIEVARFSFRLRRKPPSRLLFVGQLVPEKGVHTAIEALSLLRTGPRGGAWTLTVVGKGRGGYERQLRRQVNELGLVEQVHFAGFQQPRALPAIYARHDVLLFPSLWNEPFGITPLEAMASGLPVVATTTGGSGELFRHETNALVFSAGDAGECAAAVRRLQQDEGLRTALSENARRDVEKRFAIQGMTDRLQQDLADVVRAQSTGR